MQASNAPSKIVLPWANSGTKNTIPVPSQISVTPGAASFTDGFPPLTFTAPSAGGVPPFGADFNGIFNAITAILRWQSGGGMFQYDATWSSDNSGYPKGAILLKANESGFWVNTTDNNTTDPDTGGAGWADLSTSVNIVTFTSSGTYTPSANMRYCIVRMRGGGGGGGATVTTNGGGGGGGAAGGWAEILLTAAQVGASQAITIGAGGAGDPAGGTTTGSTGGSTSFGSIATVPGGYGGQSGDLGAGGAISQSPTISGLTGTWDKGQAGGGGGSGGGVGGGPAGGNGGSYQASGGNAGYGSGGGGAGAAANAAGGNGGGGIVEIIEYIGA